MTYTCRPATPEDAPTIAPLWANFAQSRASVDPSMQIKPQFDFAYYLQTLLSKPLNFGFLLEHDQEGTKTIVGCFIVYAYDEAPPPELPEDLKETFELENPFQPRRVGSVLGLYVHPDHRNPQSIKQLIDQGLAQAQALQVSDLDILVGNDQTGLQAFLEQSGFSKVAVQYTRSFPLPDSPERPSLHPPRPEIPEANLSAASSIPLLHPKTKELVKDPQGNPVFLSPLKNETTGEILKSSNGVPILPMPLQNFETGEFVFDRHGNLVTYPLLRDDEGGIFECNGLPQFIPPVRNKNDRQFHQDQEGNHCFATVERNIEGKMLLTPEGYPVFKEFINEETHDSH